MSNIDPNLQELGHNEVAAALASSESGAKTKLTKVPILYLWHEADCGFTLPVDQWGLFESVRKGDKINSMVVPPALKRNMELLLSRQPGRFHLEERTATFDPVSDIEAEIYKNDPANLGHILELMKNEIWSIAGRRRIRTRLRGGLREICKIDKIETDSEEIPAKSGKK